jgi:hypothetical protein
MYFIRVDNDQFVAMHASEGRLQIIIHEQRVTRGIYIKSNFVGGVFRYEFPG